MNNREQTTAFYNELTAVVTRFSQEFNLSVAEAIGVVEMVKSDIIQSAKEAHEDE